LQKCGHVSATFSPSDFRIVLQRFITLHIFCRNHTLTQDGIGSIQKPPAICAHRLPRYIAHYFQNRLETHTIAGDMNTLFAARTEARKNFESNRNLAPGSEELSKQITHAEEVAKFLRENVVQGQAAGDDNYSMLLENQSSWLWLI
jgi:complex III assembly factor LYRM7